MAHRCEYCKEICFDFEICACKGGTLESRVKELEDQLADSCSLSSWLILEKENRIYEEALEKIASWGDWHGISSPEMEEVARNALHRAAHE